MMMRKPSFEEESGSVEARVDERKEGAAAAPAASVAGGRRKYSEEDASGFEATTNNKRAKIDTRGANVAALAAQQEGDNAASIPTGSAATAAVDLTPSQLMAANQNEAFAREIAMGTPLGVARSIQHQTSGPSPAQAAAVSQAFGMLQLPNNSQTSRSSSTAGAVGHPSLFQQQQQQGVGPTPASLLLASADLGVHQDYLQGYLTNLQRARASTVANVVNPAGLGHMQQQSQVLPSATALQGHASALGMAYPFGSAAVAAAPSPLDAAAVLSQNSLLSRDPFVLAALQNRQLQNMTFASLGGASPYASMNAGMGGGMGQDQVLGSLMGSAGRNTMLPQGLGGHGLGDPHQGSLARPSSSFLGSTGGGASVPSGGVSPVDGFPLSLPVILAQYDDAPNLTNHQVLLRQQVEVFQATEDDASTHTRGRNKPIMIGQVGVRCKHCKHLPVLRRQKGSTYFPNSLTGLYQAVQNMNTVHMQCGLCTEMPENVKQQFVHSMCYSKVHQSGAGRHYWAKAAKKLGLVDTEEHGIRFIREIPSGAKVVDKMTK